MKKRALIKVFKLDDYDWWAGESLEACIDEGRRQCGRQAYPDAYQDGHEVSDEAMQTMVTQVDEDRSAEPITFAAHLAQLLASKYEKFPQLFASTED